MVRTRKEVVEAVVVDREINRLKDFCEEQSELVSDCTSLFFVRRRGYILSLCLKLLELFSAVAKMLLRHCCARAVKLVVASDRKPDGLEQLHRIHNTTTDAYNTARQEHLT